MIIGSNGSILRSASVQTFLFLHVAQAGCTEAQQAFNGDCTHVPRKDGKHGHIVVPLYRWESREGLVYLIGKF